jgi:hypothetical protein
LFYISDVYSWLDSRVGWRHIHILSDLACESLPYGTPGIPSYENFTATVVESVPPKPAPDVIIAPPIINLANLGQQVEDLNDAPLAVHKEVAVELIRGTLPTIIVTAPVETAILIR